MEKEVLPLMEMLPAYLLILLLLVILLILAIGTTLLKDHSNLPVKQRPYSLSRTQLAWWTFIVLASYIYIWAGNGYEISGIKVLTDSALILMGISISTTAAGRVIDTADNTHEDRSRHQDENDGGFFSNLLSDNHGISIHRFQKVAFTIILGINFMIMVVRKLAMPEYDQQTLALMGISAAAYAGLKITENKTGPPKDSATAPTDTDQPATPGSGEA